MKDHRNVPGAAPLRHRDQRQWPRWGLLLCALMLAACASAPLQRAQTTPPPEPTVDLQWHSCRAHFDWPPDSRPVWPRDAFIAGEVYAPALQAALPHIQAWRFHRRAARDAVGHRFSLLVYTDSATGAHLAEQIEKAPPTLAAQQAGWLKKLQCSTTGGWSGPDIAATSDDNWSPALQRAWPAYIQGVSQLWLDLLLQSRPVVPAGAGLDEHLGAYAEAHRTVDAIWRREGRHALLHHLNAIFGYRPLEMRY